MKQGSGKEKRKKEIVNKQCFRFKGPGLWGTTYSTTIHKTNRLVSPHSGWMEHMVKFSSNTEGQGYEMYQALAET